jgi:NAD(P)-dependent dehydrogenase (short-subunit alcohol dehydrogenase family)
VTAGTGRSVLVTGASTGIGHETARMLRGRGYRVLATARKADDLATLAAEGFEALPLDLADPDSVAACASAAIDRTGGGGPWALFNNAGFGLPGAVEDLTRAALRAQFEVNLFGTVDLTVRLLPAMRRAGTGRVVMNSSVLGFVSLPLRGAYTASKHALEAIADTLRLELHGTGVFVCLIEPGPVRSRFRENALAAFAGHVDPEESPFAARYARATARGFAAINEPPFTLPPEAVARAVLKALSARRPRARYRVTLPAHALGVLTRLLPDRALDALLRRLA